MGTVNTCDGSGVPIPTDTPTTGFLGKQYCEEARAIAERYLKEVDDLHSESSAAFQSNLNELRARYRTQLRELPDGG